jgi:hypothetical protein
LQAVGKAAAVRIGFEQPCIQRVQVVDSSDHDTAEEDRADRLEPFARSLRMRTLS